MRKFTSTILVALLTFSIGAGTVAAKPKADKPAKDNGALVLKVRGDGTSSQVGAWDCAGVYVKNKNHTRVNAECTVADVGPYSGTYTSATHDVPVWLVGDGSGFLDDAVAMTGLSEDELSAISWQVVVTPNGDGSGTVDAVAFLN